ncbi:MAG: hypothetical protein WCO56_06680 [Verrucomicrobiota bacterium]
MAKTLSKQLDKLYTGTEESQIDATLELALLLERTLFPGRHDATHQLILSKELMNLQISPHEKNEIVRSMCAEVLGNRVCHEARMSLIGSLGNLIETCCLETIVEFLEAHADSLNDEDAYTVLVSLNLWHYPEQCMVEVKNLLAKHHTVNVLEKLTERRSERLEEPIKRVVATITKFNS